MKKYVKALIEKENAGRAAKLETIRLHAEDVKTKLSELEAQSVGKPYELRWCLGQDIKKLNAELDALRTRYKLVRRPRYAPIPDVHTHRWCYKKPTTVQAKDKSLPQSLKNYAKYVCVVKEKEGEKVFQWKPFSYYKLATEGYYKDKLITLSDGNEYPIKKVLEFYEQLYIKKSFLDCKKIWKHLDAVLDKWSRDRITEIYKDKRIPWAETYDDVSYAEYKKHKLSTLPIAPTDEEILNCAEVYDVPLDEIIAWSVHFEDYYNGEANTVEYSPLYGVLSDTAQDYADWLKIVDKKYNWLFKCMSIAKAFGIEPKWQETMKNGELVRGISLRDAKELQQVTNWYAGNADKLQDFSDTVTLHHKNGVDTIDVSEYTYYLVKNEFVSNDELVSFARESVYRQEQLKLRVCDDYDRLECKDFQCSLYAAEEEDEDE